MRVAHILLSLQGVPAEKMGIWLERRRETGILKETVKKKIRTADINICFQGRPFID